MAPTSLHDRPYENLSPTSNNIPTPPCLFPPFPLSITTHPLPPPLPHPNIPDPILLPTIIPHRNPPNPTKPPNYTSPPVLCTASSLQCLTSVPSLFDSDEEGEGRKTRREGHAWGRERDMAIRKGNGREKRGGEMGVGAGCGWGRGTDVYGLMLLRLPIFLGWYADYSRSSSSPYSLFPFFPHRPHRIHLSPPNLTSS